ncbi:MAG: TonB-dependent receptor [Paludibacter sp.]|nr:TonB-dependent receptor [Paludibacter sp.]
MQKIWNKIFFLLICISVLLINNISAQNIENDSVKYLDEVQIIGKKITSEIIPPRRLSGEVLQSLSSQSVADAVRFFSGVQVKDYGGIGGLKTINIRSMGTNQMGVFYDGIQLGNAQNGQVDLGRFSLDNIESISIYNGQKSSALQSAKDYGAAGTIYLQTLKPKFSENKNFNIIARLKSGSSGLINPSFLWQQNFKNLFAVSLGAEFLHANGKYKFHYKSFNTTADTIAVRKNGDINAFRSEIALFGNIKNGGDWKIHFYNYNSQRGLPGYIARNLFEHLDRQWDNNFFTQISIKKSFQKYSLLFNAKYANDYTHYENPDFRTQFVDVNYRQNEIYFSFANSYKPLKIWEIALSTDYQFNNLFSNRDDFSFPVRNTFLTAFSSNIKLKFVKIQTSILGTFIKDKVKIGVAQSQKPQFTPAIITTFSPFKLFPLDFRAFYKRIFRMPTFNDLYYTITTNSYLKPEFVQQYGLGTEYSMRQSATNVKKLNFSTDFYYNFVENKIVATPTVNPFRWQMMNLGKVKIIGVDLSADIELVLIKDLIINILANYSYQNARDFSNKKDIFYGHLIPYSPQNCINLAINFDYKKFSFNYSFLYTGERFSSSENYVENYLYPFQTHDISTGYFFIFKSKNKIHAETHKVSVNLKVNNIFNKQYDIVLNYPMPGTNFKVAVGWEF